jgi:NAD+ kinase
MGWLDPVDMSSSGEPRHSIYGTVIRFGGVAYQVKNSLNVWSSGIWLCTAMGSTAAMAAAGGMPMELASTNLQYLIREHMIEKDESGITRTIDIGLLEHGQKLHLRWNSQKGRIFIDELHLTHNLELGDEILVDNEAPPLLLFKQDDVS